MTEKKKKTPFEEWLIENNVYIQDEKGAERPTIESSKYPYEHEDRYKLVDEICKKFEEHLKAFGFGTEELLYNTILKVFRLGAWMCLFKGRLYEIGGD